MAEPSTIYKLIILYMLDKLDFPLTNTQISDFFLEKDYTTYFNIQQVLGNLVDSDLILTESTHNNTQYSITAAGRDTLTFFQDKISPEIENDIHHYFDAHQMEIKCENSLLADYYKTTRQDYAVRLQLKEKGVSRIDLTLSLPNKELAEAVCSNWRNSSEDVYTYLMDILIR